MTVSSDVLGLSTAGGGATVDGNRTLQTLTNLDPILTDFATMPGNFDSITLTVAGAVIPEPSTIFAALFLAGGALVIRRKRRASAE